MTTITNFLHSNFLDIPQETDLPLWSVAFPSTLSHKQLREYFINNCIRQNKILLHVDLGLNQLRKIYSITQIKPIFSENGLNLYQPTLDKPYYILQSDVESKLNEEFLINILALINKFRSIEAVKNIVKKQKKISLFIEGFETICAINKNLKNLEYFLTSLSNINNIYGQITVIVLSKQIPQQIMFAIERISSCVTTILTLNTKTYECVSTVRRYTGFSNQQSYLINFSSQQAKVQKKKKQIGQKQTQSQKQMIKSLGFAVKKNRQLTEEQQKMRKMIYPHLQVQQQNKCQCDAKNCRTCHPGAQQGLIILDDQQQDDDDIDV